MVVYEPEEQYDKSLASERNSIYAEASSMAQAPK